MQNKNFRRPSEVKRWLDNLASLGSVLTQQRAVLHHPIGESAKHNKTPVGMWWVIPLTDEQHKQLHNDRSEFEKDWSNTTWGGRFDFEKALFQDVVLEYERVIGPSPIPPSVYENILGYHR